MEKLLLSLVLPFATLGLFAQIDKGNTLLGGSLSFNFSQNNISPENNATNTNIQPSIQFAYKANRTIGFGMNFFYQSSSNGDLPAKSQQFSLSPSIGFTQYHPLKGNFGWWLQERVGASFYNGKQTNGSNETKSTYTSFFGDVTPGIYYAVGDKKQWLLNASVGGLGGAYGKNGNNENWGIYTTIFQNYQFGFAYVFRKS